MARRILPALLAFGVISLILALDPPQPRPAGARSNMPALRKTGAPLTGEGSCADCHGTKVNNTGNGSLTITTPTTYTPGQVYTITVTEQDPGQARWGFELTALKDSDHSMGGAIASTTTLTGTGTSGGITYIAQTTGTGGDGTFNGTANGPVSWSFQWTAPASGSGAVTFYAAGAAANTSGTPDNGDFTYVVTKAVTEEVPTAVLPTTWGMIKTRYR